MNTLNVLTQSRKAAKKSAGIFCLLLFAACLLASGCASTGAYPAGDGPLLDTNVVPVTIHEVVFLRPHLCAFAPLRENSAAESEGC